jgi:F0F1-type ATP synthase epsilon subunit
MAQLIHVRINSPEKLIWEGEAEWVSSENDAGPFDILPLHSNFITFLEKRKIKIKNGTSGNVDEYDFDHSVMYAHSNTVYIYTNI